MRTEDELKAKAVMEFAGMMVGAYTSGFVHSHEPTIAEVYQVARNHVKDTYGVDTKPLTDEIGQELADLCMTGA